ncbi:hypothetical protein SVAN01_08723 [Stagonosporopsis vannaccii]|nr:hypothetical protein SVAN01_08723 [Stagonosporopsis vannaccii]
MTISTTFVLGANSSYFFNTPTHWAHHNLPSDITALFTHTPPIDVIELALGTNGAYFLSYRDHANLLQCKHYNLPNPLVEYLYASHPSVIRDLSTLSIALGPYDSYYAWDRYSASWSNIPPGLEKALLHRLESQHVARTVWKADGYEAPCFVSLGSDGSYFMRTVSGGGMWDLKLPKAAGRSGLGTVGGDGWEGMRGMNRFLEESRDFTGIAAMHLMTTQANAYVLILTNGKTFSNLPEHTWADYAKMADKLPSFVQHMAPLPPMPQLQLQPQPQLPPQPQQHPALPPDYKQSQRAQSGCCPPVNANAQHACCPPAPMQARPWPMPPINAPPS